MRGGKKPGDKKGEDDFSDAPTLPSANAFTFSYLLGHFDSKETREKVQKYISEKLPQDRVKTLTRDEIFTYAKSKGLFPEQKELDKLPPDDPRHKMTES